MEVAILSYLKRETKHTNFVKLTKIQLGERMGGWLQRNKVAEIIIGTGKLVAPYRANYICFVPRRSTDRRDRRNRIAASRCSDRTFRNFLDRDRILHRGR